MCVRAHVAATHIHAYQQRTHVQTCIHTVHATVLRSVRAVATAVIPYTTACSPNKIALPGALAMAMVSLGTINLCATSIRMCSWSALATNTHTYSNAERFCVYSDEHRPVFHSKILNTHGRSPQHLFIHVSMRYNMKIPKPPDDVIVSLFRGIVRVNEYLLVYGARRALTTASIE
jgi:hypothetical protein